MRSALLAALGVATVAGLFSVAQLRVETLAQGRDLSGAKMLRLMLPFWYLWAVMVPVILWWYRRVRRYADALWLRLILHAPLAVALAVVHSALLFTSQVTLRVTDFTGGLLPGTMIVLAWHWSVDLGVYVLIVAALVWSGYRDRLHAERRRAADLDSIVVRERLRALRQQVNPHFLFNTLNTVGMLVRARRNEDATRMVDSLGELLHHMLRENATEVVPLSHEIDLVVEYLAIEQLRIGERLHIDLQIQPDVTAALVPDLILLPIVENAVKHGAERTGGPAAITITAARHDAALLLCVHNAPGARHDGLGDRPGGIGLANVERRLALMYGAAASAAIEHEETEVIVRVRLPLRIATA